MPPRVRAPLNNSYRREREEKRERTKKRDGKREKRERAEKKYVVVVIMYTFIVTDIIIDFTVS